MFKLCNVVLFYRSPSAKEKSLLDIFEEKIVEYILKGEGEGGRIQTKGQMQKHRHTIRSSVKV